MKLQAPNPNWETPPFNPNVEIDINTVIVDSFDNEPLQGVTAVVVEDENIWASSNEEGKIFLQGVQYSQSVKFIYQGSEKVYPANAIPEVIDFTIGLDTVYITDKPEKSGFKSVLIGLGVLAAAAYFLTKEDYKKVSV